MKYIIINEFKSLPALGKVRGPENGPLRTPYLIGDEILKNLLNQSNKPKVYAVLTKKVGSKMVAIKGTEILLTEDNYLKTYEELANEVAETKQMSRVEETPENGQESGEGDDGVKNPPIVENPDGGAPLSDLNVQETPVATPVDETPVATPVDETPVATPVDETPVATPVDETPVAEEKKTNKKSTSKKNKK